MRLRSIVVIASLALGLLGAPLPTEAQKGEKVHRIGYLLPIDRSTSAPLTEAFLQGLRELGYVEGKNIVIEWRLAQGRFEGLPELAADLVRLDVGVIVAPAPPYVRAARNATSTIPIVFALVPDPEFED